MKDRATRWWWWCLTVALTVVVVGVEARRTKECEMKPSSTAPDKMDIHCNCMQRLEKVSVAVARLTINQTGCAEAGLEVSWAALEAEVGPEVLVMESARVHFTEDGVVAPRRSSITSITFINCTFLEVPSHAFRGLQLLEEVRLEGGAAGVLRGGAFSDMPRLRRVEVANAHVGVVEGGAWAGLPALTHLALWRCSLGELKSHAVNLTLGGNDDDGETCGAARGTSEEGEDHHRMEEVMAGRSGLGAANQSLPHFGKQLLLFQNNIEVLAPHALSGDAFGFLMMGGNAVGRMGGAALNLALHNPCEISAALLVANTLTGLDDGALEGLRGRRGAPHRTFLALTNNTFSSVAPQAFTLHEDLHVFSAGKNRFRCRCKDLHWAAPAATEERRELQEALLTDGLCQDGTSLAAFTTACTHTPRPPSPTILPPPAPTDSPSTPDDHTTPQSSPSLPPGPTPPPPHHTTISPSTSTHDPDSGANTLAFAPATLLTLLLARILI